MRSPGSTTRVTVLLPLAERYGTQHAASLRGGFGGEATETATLIVNITLPQALAKPKTRHRVSRAIEATG